MKLTECFKAGYLDHQERSPWKRAPQTEAEAKAGETPEQEAYWVGWTAGVNDALARHVRKRKQDRLQQAYKQEATKNAAKTFEELGVTTCSQ